MSQMLVEPGAEYPAADARGHDLRSGFLAVVEQGASGWGAYVPDLPGVVAVADSEGEVRELIGEAVEFHIEGLREEGDPVPVPLSRALWLPG